MKKFNYRLTMEGEIVASTEEEAQKLLAQAVEQLVQQAKPGKIEAFVIDGVLPTMVEDGSAAANGELTQAIDRLGQQIRDGLGEYTRMGRESMEKFLAFAHEGKKAKAPAVAGGPPAADPMEPTEPVSPSEVMGNDGASTENGS